MTDKRDEIRIRPMNPADIDAVVAIDRKISGLNRSITYSINEMIGGQIECSFIAEVENTPVGFVLSSLSYIPGEIFEACVIQTMGVDPAHWHKGIASKLINALMDAARSKGVEIIRIMVDQRDDKLVGFFERLDFNRGRFIDYSKNIQEP